MAKNNIRSFRYSDEVKEILENFDGVSMNEKFENLVKYCFGQVPVVETRLKDLNREIEEKQDKLRGVRLQVKELDIFIMCLQGIKEKISAAAVADGIARTADETKEFWGVGYEGIEQPGAPRELWGVGCFAKPGAAGGGG